MAEAEKQQATEGGAGNRIGRSPDSLRSGLLALIVAVACTAGAVITGYPSCCFLILITGVILPLGGLAVLLGLRHKANRRPPRLWQNLAALAGIIVLLYVLTIGPAGGTGLLNLRMRGLVAMTGGQGRLQSWAVEVVAQPRDGENGRSSIEETFTQWDVPRSSWSKQVRRLRPGRVFIERVFRDGQEGVLLRYGGGFLHWYIVIGPPGSVPDPKLDENLADSDWFRWSDGVYCWFVG